MGNQVNGRLFSVEKKGGYEIIIQADMIVSERNRIEELRLWIAGKLV